MNTPIARISEGLEMKAKSDQKVEKSSVGVS
jgi:hypothetical protein